jgi:SAM-dependent methyltransferase
MEQARAKAAAAAYGREGMRLLDRVRTCLIAPAIRRRLPRARPLAILDVGCGHFAAFLMAHQDILTEGWGLDLSIDDRCKAAPRLRFLEGPVEESLAALPAERFDAVLLISVLEHLADPLAALRHCHRALRDGARLIVHVPTWAAKPVLEFAAFRLGISHVAGVDEHKTYYGRRDLWPLLVRAGFRPSRIRLRSRFLGMTLLGTAQK